MHPYETLESSEALVFEFRNSKSESIDIDNTDEDFKVFTIDRLPKSDMWAAVDISAVSFVKRKIKFLLF